MNIHNDMVEIVDQGCVGALTLLDMSAIFHTVDHSILLEVSRRLFEINGNIHRCTAEFFSRWNSVSFASRQWRVWRHDAAVRSTSTFGAWSASIRFTRDPDMFLSLYVVHALHVVNSDVTSQSDLFLLSRFHDLTVVTPSSPAYA